MEDVDKTIAQAVADEVILGAVLVAKDKSGNLDYHRAFGNRQVSPEAKPMQSDTVLAIASMTKLMTTIAALQLVERGAVTLDEDVTGHLEVLGRQNVIKGFQSDGTPIVEKRAHPITLRQLLTHSSGVGYDFQHSEIHRYKKFHKLPSGETINERFGTPLLHQPGEGWTYGGSMDWVGRLVEILSGLSLEDYMKKNIWDPLGIKDATFWPATRSKEYRERQSAMSIRDTKTGRAVQSRKPIDLGSGLTEAAGGQGAFITMGDYMKVMHSLLVDDERLLRKDTTEIMFKPQLSPPAKASLLEYGWSVGVGNFPETNEYDWGLGGILIDGDKHPYRKRNALLWSGAPNLVWFIDRIAGVCGVFGCQLLPTKDEKIEGLTQVFEEGVYNYSTNRTKL